MENNNKLSNLIGKITRIIDERPYESKMAFLGTIAGTAECIDERIERCMNSNHAIKEEIKKSSLE